MLREALDEEACPTPLFFSNCRRHRPNRKPHGPTSLGAQAAATVSPAPPTQKQDQYALSRVDFSDPALRQQPGYGAGPAYQQPATVPQPPGSSEGEQLRKPSLVFVRSANESSISSALGKQPAVLEQRLVGSDLPPGTRLVARLEAGSQCAGINRSEVEDEKSLTRKE
jgi:hypothetical protein